MGDVFDNRMPQSPSADINHGGYHSNTTTVDSWVEGWAEFWSLMVADEISGTAKPEIYPVGASRINMEENRKAWQLWGGKAYEELAVASALWDLYDGKDEKDKDNIDMTTDQVLDILASNYYTDLNPTNVPTGGLPYGYPFDVLTIYSATISHTLKYGYTVTDVNHVFREHGLCYDKNNNQKCDDGERVGQSTNSGRPNRRNQPTVEGSYVAYTASDVDAGTPLTITDFLVSVAYAPPFEDYSYAYTTHAEQDTPGLLYSVAPSPEYAATVIITPLLSLYRSLDPLTYSTEFYWAEMDLLPTASFIEHAFVLERVYPAYLPIVLKSH
jgi:hypothetical protein